MAGQMMADPTRTGQQYGAHHGDYNPHQTAYGADRVATGVTAFGGDLTPLQNRIYQHVKQCSDTNEGMSITYLVRQLAPEGFAETQIRDNVEWLISEGHLYSTIDDDHCKTTDAGY